MVILGILPEHAPIFWEGLCSRGTFSFLMKPEKVTLVEWEVWSMNDQDEVNSGERWQVTKSEEAKTKDQAQVKRWC